VLFFSIKSTICESMKFPEVPHTTVIQVYLLQYLHQNTSYDYGFIPDKCFPDRCFLYFSTIYNNMPICTYITVALIAKWLIC